MSKAADFVAQAVSEILTYNNLLDIHLLKIQTNNPLERVMKEM